MLVTLNDVLRHAEKHHTAIGAFNTPIPTILLGQKMRKILRSLLKVLKNQRFNQIVRPS